MSLFTTTAPNVRVVEEAVDSTSRRRKIKRRSMRSNFTLRLTLRYGIYLRPLNYTALHYPHSTPTAIMPKSCIICSAVALSAAPLHRQLSNFSTVLLASPPCIVPGLVRGKIGRLEEAAQENMQASQRGAWRQAVAD
jgi:hypothetical protein